MPIKIGISQDPWKRAKVLSRQHLAPLYVTAQIPGNLDLERALDRRFAEGALGAEWFCADAPGLHEFASDALHFEGFYFPDPDERWPGDSESPAIKNVLAVYAEIGWVPVPPGPVREG